MSVPKGFQSLGPVSRPQTVPLARSETGQSTFGKDPQSLGPVFQTVPLARSETGQSTEYFWERLLAETLKVSKTFKVC
jgi:hypothetical protein